MNILVPGLQMNDTFKEKKADKRKHRKSERFERSRSKIQPSIRSKENNTASDTVNNNSENEKVFERFTQKEKKLTEDFCNDSTMIFLFHQKLDKTKQRN